MAPTIQVTPEQQERITNDILNKLFNRVSLPKSVIDKLKSVIIEEIDLKPVIEAVMNKLPIPRNGVNGSPGEDGVNGKDAEITDGIISEITLRAIVKIQEIFKKPEDGKDGRQGERGLQGLPGRDGLVGPAGAVGFRGTQGERGETGIKGDRGQIGATGSIGLQGPVGEKGNPGENAAITSNDIQRVFDLLDLSGHITKKDLDKTVKNLMKDLALGKLELPIQELGGGLSGKHLINEINRVLGGEGWQEFLPYDGQKGANLEWINLNDAPTDVPVGAGVISWNSSQLTAEIQSGIGTTLQLGQEEYFLVYNDTASIIPNGKACYASGVNVANNVLTVGLADNSNFLTSAQVLGLATHDIGINQLGLVTWRGRVNDFNTTTTGFGLSYLGTAGNLTNIKPLYPANRISMGAMIKSGTTDGIFQVAISALPRRSASRSYSFTSADAAAGVHWRAGFYDWSATSIALNQGSLTVNHGAAGLSRAAHVGIVPLAAGTVDTGQVGLQVTGTLDSEASGQIAAQTAIITDDITTLTANVMAESLEKFSGTVALSLYIVSGTPTAYSLTFNYGYSKYEDFRNIDGTVTAFSAVWEAGQVDTVFDISLKFHTAIGWTYAATGFSPGNGNICNRLTDQAIDSNLAIGVDGAYKRTNLNQFITGTSKEGVIIEVFTGGTKSIRSMDLHISAFSEELF